MRSWRGLRGRITLALVAVSALTVVVTAVLLLAPLDRQLRTDRLADLEHAARTAAPMFFRLPASAYHRGSPTLLREATRLRRSSAADVTITDAAGRVLVSTDPDGAVDADPTARQAVRRHRTSGTIAREDGDGDGDVAEVVRPLDVGGRRYALVLEHSLSDLVSAQRVLRRGLVLAGAIALLVAVASGLVLASRLAARITALRDTAQRVAEVGITAEVQGDDTHDEIGDLTRTFAAMQQQLRDQEDARRTFVSTASHELRTPLASLRLMLHGALEELDDQHVDADEVRAQLLRAVGQVERLTQLSGMLLDLSRLDARLPLRREVVELSDLARSVVAEFAPRSQVRLAAGPRVWTVADPGAVTQILRVLVDNADRHGRPPVVVEVTDGDDETERGGDLVPADRSGVDRPSDAGRQARGAAAVIVRDEGPGIPEDEADLVFERFRRGRDSGAVLGSGLGLAIGRELADRMGGELRLVPSRAGAVFVLDLPAAPAPTTD